MRVVKINFRSAKSIDFARLFKIFRCNWRLNLMYDFFIINEILRRVREYIEFSGYFGIFGAVL